MGFCGRQTISSYVNGIGRGQQQNTMCHRFAETIHNLDDGNSVMALDPGHNPLTLLRSFEFHI